MQCWRCKAYGHRTGDRECPLQNAVGTDSDNLRKLIEDPMAMMQKAKQDRKESKKLAKEERTAQLRALLEQDLGSKDKKKRKHKKDKENKKSKKHKDKKKEKKKHRDKEKKRDKDDSHRHRDKRQRRD
eukprot:gnl/Hemi2/27669_TR9151_c0_g1_i2.p2 gnl/Hemi2/27669_TR9151_c0_g1~~gnl/Hemi2/27669_TR9151_c0_g1_i2.p2  ORF type:complete len:128 (-),score=34.72 gnl/Hemi2/27669_TR9151_c0_g1_i2:87-470(-)